MRPVLTGEKAGVTLLPWVLGDPDGVSCAEQPLPPRLASASCTGATCLLQGPAMVEAVGGPAWEPARPGPASARSFPGCVTMAKSLNLS